MSEATSQDGLLRFIQASQYPNPSGSVPSPEFGEGNVVYLRPMSAGMALRARAMGDDGKLTPESAIDLFPECVCQADGSPYPWPTDSEKLAAMVRSLPMSLVMRVITAGLKSAKLEPDEAKN
jgi:hypothetical protein